MVQHVRALAAKPDDLNSVLRTHVVEERTDSYSFGPPHMSGHSFISTHRITHVSSRQTEW